MAGIAEALARNERNLTVRRQLGAFYTPPRLSRLLADWAINTSADTVLEPSFGGCGFLEAARDALIALGCAMPSESIYGCDIDPIAFDHLAEVFGSPVDTSGFVLGDFLDRQNEAQWPAKFSAILANPPYIPHHKIDRGKLKKLAAEPGVVSDIGGRSSLWAYFISHSLSYLALGGRMAWVLPGAFLQADYAAPIRLHIAEHFRRSLAIVIRERIFLTEGTDEETVVLLADGYGDKEVGRKSELGEARTVDDLAALIPQWDGGEWRGITTAICPAMLSMDELAITSFDALKAKPVATTLGAVARVQIGIVTGDNDFFILSQEGARAAGLEEADCTPVLAKFRATKGLSFKRADMAEYLEGGGRALLIDSSCSPDNQRVRDYLASFDVERRAKISTFKKRTIWSAPNDGNCPHAFLPVMHHEGPRLVLNDLNCVSTNTVHRVFFHADVTENIQRLASISMLTSFSQISAELVGRRYGSGVLKHEPRDAERIDLLLPKMKPEMLDQAVTAIDKALREGGQAEAMKLADKLIFTACGIAVGRTSKLFRDALQSMRLRRRPERRKLP
nr:N-6 DNA methylase [Sphingomonas sp. YR710]